MKKTPISCIATMAAGVILTLSMSTSCNKKESAGYIARPSVTTINGEFTPETLLSLGKLSDPQLSPDGSTILYGMSYTDIEQNRSCRNLFICDKNGNSRTQLTHEGKSISCARWSADGRSIWFLQGGQVWKAPLGSGKLGRKTRVTDVAGGISEFKVSPDGSRILYISSVPGSVKEPSSKYPELSKATAYTTETLMYRHWDHWVTEIPHSFVAEIGQGVVTSGKDILGPEEAAFELPTEPFGGLDQLCWSPDSKFIAYSCRKKSGREYAMSTNTGIYVYDCESGESTEIKTDGGYDTDPSWSPDGKTLAFISMERDGYEADRQRLMTVAMDGGKKAEEPVEASAGFKYNAVGPAWSPDSRYIYFNALAEGIQGIFRYSVQDGMERITGDNMWYDFNSPFAICETAEGATELLCTWCSLDFPTEIVSVSILPDEGECKAAEDPVYGNTCTCALEGECQRIANAVEAKAVTRENEYILSQMDRTMTQARKVTTVDGKEMLTWVVYPPAFDQEKTYPSILVCLGGPQGTLSQGWSYRWNYRLMASQGYVVVLPNRRGTTAFGQEWTEQISGDYAGLNIQDYLSAARELKSEPYVGKMAACGASYGGYSVYYLSGMHGDVFDCMIAHAGIFNEEHMYETTEELWFPNWDNGGMCEYRSSGKEMGEDMGAAGDGVTFGGLQQAGSPWSSEQKAVYHYAHSPHTLVTNWHTPILVIHGAMDFRVPYDEGMAAYNCAQLMGVPSKLIIFPDENHWILKPQNAIYWHREYFAWLERWLVSENS